MMFEEMGLKFRNFISIFNVNLVDSYRVKSLVIGGEVGFIGKRVKKVD